MYCLSVVTFLFVVVSVCDLVICLYCVVYVLCNVYVFFVLG